MRHGSLPSPSFFCKENGVLPDLTVLLLGRKKTKKRKKKKK
jgi:hypothetical protein